MARRINEIQLVGFTISGLVAECYTLGLDSDAPLPLQIHGIKNLLGHFTVGKAATDLDEAICQRGFTVVDVGDDGEVTDSAQFSHRQ